MEDHTYNSASYRRRKGDLNSEGSNEHVLELQSDGTGRLPQNQTDDSDSENESIDVGPDNSDRHDDVTMDINMVDEGKEKNNKGYGNDDDLYEDGDGRKDEY